jgi:Ca2+-binding EF-hand superfamily protein
MGAQLSKRS